MSCCSLGVVPVLTISQEWSGGEGWLQRVDQLTRSRSWGPSFPHLESNIVELDYEEILSYAPDLIIATAENFDETAYKRLAEIAPTLALRPRGEFTWRTSMEDVGAVVGEPEKAEEVVARAEAVVAGIQQAHPEFEGKTFVMSRALLEGNTSNLRSGHVDAAVAQRIRTHSGAGQREARCRNPDQ